MNITEADYASLSWHQRRRFDERIRIETARLLDQLERLQAACNQVQSSAEYVQAEARRILAILPPDPDARAHLAQLRNAITEDKE